MRNRLGCQTGSTKSMAVAFTVAKRGTAMMTLSEKIKLESSYAVSVGDVAFNSPAC